MDTFLRQIFQTIAAGIDISSRLRYWIRTRTESASKPLQVNSLIGIGPQVQYS